MNEFRLKLNLSNFFSDVRVSSFIYVSSEIETIDDLQKRISNLFHISEELILLCDNHFLPGEETVKILKEDEVLKVIEGGIRKVLKVKKRKLKQDNLFELDLPSKVKKKKERLHGSGELAPEPEILNKNEKQLDESNHEIEAVGKEKRETLSAKSKKDCLNSLGELKESFSEIDTLNKQKKKKQFNETTKEEKNEFSVKNKVVTHRKKIEPMPISTVAKVIKSVKVTDDKGWPTFVPTAHQFTSFIQDEIEISKTTSSFVEVALPVVEEPKFLKERVEKSPTVSLPQEETQLATEEVLFEEKMDTSDTELPIIVKEVEQKLQENKIIIHSKEKLISNLESDTISHDGSDVESKTENESTNSSVISKRKRRRIRKRKSKAKASEIENPPVPLPVFRTALAVKNVHIKFDDDLNPQVVSEVAEPVLEETETALPPCEKLEEVSPPCSDTKAVVEALENEVDRKEDALVDESISLVVNKAVIRKEILSYPIMKGKPKVNDLVAFKKYVLSENYTPEISDFVIAKVYNFDDKTQELVLDILEGGEQCGDPNGKFSLKDSEEAEDVKKIEINWSEMIEPRLVYP